MNDEIIDLIFEQTKLYNQWRSLNTSSRTVKDMKREEIKIVIGITLQMRIVKLPNRRIYWAPNYRNFLNFNC